MNNYRNLLKILQGHNATVPTYAARFRCWSRDRMGELWTLLSAEGKFRVAVRDFWNDQFLGWSWICDPDGYQERDCHIDDNVHILLCDQEWNIIKNAPIETQRHEHYIGYEELTSKLKTELISSGEILPKEQRTSYKSLLKPKFEEDNMGEQYFENVSEFRWKEYGKPTVVRRFEWAGMPCYVLRQTFFHTYYNVDKELVWVICGPKYWGLPHTILSNNASLNDGSRVRRPVRPKYNPTLRVDEPDRYGNTVNCRDNSNYIELSAPSVKVYRDFCKENGLRPIIAKCRENDYKNFEIGFDICELRPYPQDPPQDFTPYPMMSCGSTRMGGYKVVGDKLIIWRPNPNAHEPCMTWQEYREWAKTHVQL